MKAIEEISPASTDEAAPEQELRKPSYWPFVVPALVVVLAIISTPWLFTIWMSLNEWKVGSPEAQGRFRQLSADAQRSPLRRSGWPRPSSTALSVVLRQHGMSARQRPSCSTRNFPGRGFLRAVSSSCR